MWWPCRSIHLCTSTLSDCCPSEFSPEYVSYVIGACIDVCVMCNVYALMHWTTYCLWCFRSCSSWEAYIQHMLPQFVTLSMSLERKFALSEWCMVSWCVLQWKTDLSWDFALMLVRRNTLTLVLCPSLLVTVDPVTCCGRGCMQTYHKNTVKL